MEILTEFDGLQEALKKVKMDEAVLPYCNGRLVDSDAFNKTQKILNCPEMISAHKYLYNLDMDQLTEEEIAKIDQLYKLGCDRGFIADDLTDWDADGSATEQSPVEEPTEEPVEKTPAEKATTTLFKAKVPCWTVIYSATSKDGEIKTGEAYSNAVTASAAKADVNAKLSRIGYSNISILAIESCDYDVTGATTVVDGSNEVEEDDDVEETEDIEENDMLRNRPHNAHIDDPAGIVSEKDDEESSDDAEDAEPEDDGSEKSEDSSDDSSDDAGDDDASSDEESDADAGDDSSEDSSEDDSEESSNEETDDEDSSDGEDDSSNEDSDENSDDEDSKEDLDKEDDDSDDEDSEEDSDDSKKDSDDDEEKEELDANKKSELRDEYRMTFKNVLSKCKFTKSFNDLTLEEKVKFFTELSKAWKKNEPNEFMTDKEIDQLNNVVVNEEND